MPKKRKPDSPAEAPVPAALPTAAARMGNSLPSAKPAPAFYTTKQLAERWALSERQVHRYLDSGALIATRFSRSVRISIEEVARFETERFGVK